MAEMELPRMEILSTEMVEENGVRYIKKVCAVDFGRAGTARVVVKDPCCTEEEQEQRRQHIRRVCEDLVRRGEI